MELEDNIYQSPESKTAMLLDFLIRDYKRGDLVIKVDGDIIVWNNGLYQHYIYITNDVIYIDGAKTKKKPEIAKDYVEVGRYLFSKYPFWRRLKLIGENLLLRSR